METDEKTPSTGDHAEGTEMAAELAAAKTLAEENHKKFLYAMADFENYKKRIERQFADIAVSGKKSVLAKFLPVIDNLERALAQENTDNLRDGLTVTHKGFEALLNSEGVRSYSIKGERFDPRLAEAIATQPSDLAADTVLEEPVRGYYLGEEVLRPAQVVVAKSPD
jgi:molecular chaperone GrpE